MSDTDPLDEIGAAIRHLHHAFEIHGLGAPDLVLTERDDVMRLRQLMTARHTLSMGADSLPSGVAMKMAGASIYYPRPEGQ